LHFEIDYGFISLNAAKYIAWLDFIANFFIPLFDVALLLLNQLRLTFSIVGDKFGISSLI